MSKLDLNDIINYVSRVLYIVDKYSISIDKAFQKVKHNWKFRESFKVYYDVCSSVLRNYYQLKFLARKLLNSESNKAIVRTWILIHGSNYFRRRDLVHRFVNRVLKKRKIRLSDIDAIIEELKSVDYVRYLSIKYSYPEEFVRKLSQLLDFRELEELLRAMNSEYIWLRINTLKIDIDKAVKILEDEGIAIELNKEVPFLGLVIEAKRPIHHVSLIKRGFVIIQDKASVMTALSLRPEPHDYILDLCAAPGGKTSLIMQLVENKAKICAVDISRARLLNMMKLMRRYGVDSSKIDYVLADSRKLRLKGRFNKVLIDAPCSSSGAILRDPSIKLSLKRLDKINWYASVQSGLVENVIHQLRDVEIIYSTCSILPEEGEEVICRFLDCVKIEKPLTMLHNGYSKYDFNRCVGRTFPHLDKCEGHFICKLKV